MQMVEIYWTVSLVFFCAVFFFFWNDTWANLCGVDLIRNPKRNAPSKGRPPRNCSGNTNVGCDISCFCQYFSSVSFWCGGFFGKPGEQMVVVFFQALHQIAQLTLLFPWYSHFPSFQDPVQAPQQCFPFLLFEKKTIYKDSGGFFKRHANLRRPFQRGRSWNFSNGKKEKCWRGQERFATVWEMPRNKKVKRAEMFFFEKPQNLNMSKGKKKAETFLKQFSKKNTKWKEKIQNQFFLKQNPMKKKYVLEHVRNWETR